MSQIGEFRPLRHAALNVRSQQADIRAHRLGWPILTIKDIQFGSCRHTLMTDRF